MKSSSPTLGGTYSKEDFNCGKKKLKNWNNRNLQRDSRKAAKKQLLTYLRIADKRLGLLLNFGAPLIKHGIFRVVNGLR